MKTAITIKYTNSRIFDGIAFIIYLGGIAFIIYLKDFFF